MPLKNCSGNAEAVPQFNNTNRKDRLETGNLSLRSRGIARNKFFVMVWWVDMSITEATKVSFPNKMGRLPMTEIFCYIFLQKLSVNRGNFIADVAAGQRERDCRAENVRGRRATVHASKCEAGDGAEPCKHKEIIYSLLDLSLSRERVLFRD